MKILLYPHGGSGNHGCEAIVRSTVKLTGAEAVLASSAPEQDRRYGLDACCRIIKAQQAARKGSLPFLTAVLKSRLGDGDALDRLAFRPVLEAAKTCDVALSIGGDNYCYGEQGFLYLLNRVLRKKGKDTILWGCSIEPDSLKGALLDDLRGYKRIIARESLSADALKAKGLKQTELFPDPAFSLERVNTSLPEGFLEGNTVGLNVSPMALGCAKDKEALMTNVTGLVESILKKTDMAVALILHVVWAKSDDRRPLQLLYEKFSNSGRVILVEDRPAEELKDIIARCRFMVAARTHACIAAYSSCVPALALGYSSKAVGIAGDVMPENEAYVLPVQSLSGPDELVDLFFRMLSRESALREHLNAFMPDYIGRLQRLSL